MIVLDQTFKEILFDEQNLKIIVKKCNDDDVTYTLELGVYYHIKVESDAETCLKKLVVDKLTSSRPVPYSYLMETDFDPNNSSFRFDYRMFPYVVNGDPLKSAFSFDFGTEDMRDGVIEREVFNLEHTKKVNIVFLDEDSDGTADKIEGVITN